MAFAFFALAQASLAVIAIRMFRRRPSLAALFLILPIAGVVWDNAIMALGNVIGDGPTLVALSWLRFIGHALLTPSWIIASVGLARRAGSPFFASRAAAIGQWVIYGLAVLAGVLRYIVFLEIVPVHEGGMLYYTYAGTFPGPPFGSIIMLLVSLICAVAVWRHARSPWMLLGSLFMLATQVIPRELVGFLVTNSGEVVMAASLVATLAMLYSPTLSVAGFSSDGQAPGIIGDRVNHHKPHGLSGSGHLSVVRSDSDW